MWNEYWPAATIVHRGPRPVKKPRPFRRLRGVTSGGLVTLMAWVVDSRRLRLGQLLTRERLVEAEFTDIYRRSLWGDGSGPGSSAASTTSYRSTLSRLLRDLEVKSVVDVGSGDWGFAREIDWSAVTYTGIDCVASLTEQCQSRFGSDRVRFIHADVTAPDCAMPSSDLLILKDVAQHWPNAFVLSAVTTMLDSTRWALVTNCAHQTSDWDDCNVAGWRPLNGDLFPLCLFGGGVEARWDTKETILIPGVKGATETSFEDASELAYRGIAVAALSEMGGQRRRWWFSSSNRRSSAMLELSLSVDGEPELRAIHRPGPLACRAGYLRGDRAMDAIAVLMPDTELEQFL